MRFSLFLSMFFLSSACFGAPKYKVIAFDAFPIFDPRPIFSKVNEIFPEKGPQITEVWRNKQFAYTWLRVAGKKYKNFDQVTEDALIFATNSAGVKLTKNQKNELMAMYLSLKPWPDVELALKKLKSTGIKLTLLSNFTEKTLQSEVNGSKLGRYFESPLSTDLIQSFKPDPSAYNLILEKFKVKKDEVLFVPFAPWDATGADWFGFDVFWVNRSTQKPEQLDSKVNGMGNTLDDLVSFVIGH